MLINICRPAYCTDCRFHFARLSLQFCASSVKEAEEWVKQIDFVLKGLSSFNHKDSLLCSNVRGGKSAFFVNVKKSNSY